MAELIDKRKAKEIFPDKGEGSWTYNVTAKAYIDSLQTTTESEIRAKAIDEFALKLHDLCGVEIGEYQYTDLLHESRIDEIAEELKEGADNGK